MPGAVQPAMFGHQSAVKAPEIIAHRGARTLANFSAIGPENTMPAFDAAARLGTAIELDVIATTDGEVIVHHDDDTGRLFSVKESFGREMPTRHLSYADLQNARFNADQHTSDVKKMFGDGSENRYTLSPQFSQTRIPKLEDVLLKHPNTHIYIELKTDNTQVKNHDNNELEQRVADLVKKLNAYDRVTVISFSTKAIQNIKKLDPKLRTGLDINAPAKYRGIPLFEKLLAFYTRHVLKADVLLPAYDNTTPGLVKAAHKRGLKIAPWVNHETRPEEAVHGKQLAAMGVDGLITNAPDLLQEALS